MGSDYKVLVLPPDAQTSAALARGGARVRAHRGWLEVLGAEWRSDAQELSKRFLTTAVWWSMQTPIDQVWVCCFHQGEVVRELRFSAEQAGWTVNRGPGMPFEDTEALAIWLRKWRARKAPLELRHGVDLLNAFIGAAPKPKPKPRPKRASRSKPRSKPKQRSKPKPKATRRS